MTMNSQSAATVDVITPIRNRYFYGKLLDVFHFEMEQNYFNTKRWLLNRVVTGYGVICGLQVLLTPDGTGVYVTPGIALDKCGREIIVCQQTEPCTLPPIAPAPAATGSPSSGTATSTSPGQPVPAAPPAGGSSMGGDCCPDTGTYYHLSICYHECPTDPSPAMGGDCDTQALCSPGAIRERYCLKLTEGKQCPPSTTSPLQSVITNGTLTYAILANYISNQSCCAPPVQDCCIPLANIVIPVSPNTYTANSIDITIRPLVYTNDLLYALMLAGMNQGQAQTRGMK